MNIPLPPIAQGRLIDRQLAIVELKVGIAGDAVPVVPLLCKGHIVRGAAELHLLLDPLKRLIQSAHIAWLCYWTLATPTF